VTVEITVNGRCWTGTIEPRTSLADFVRNQCLLTGTHLGCEHGVCGACTLFVDGEPVRSCIMLAIAADGSNVRTVEGYRDDPIMEVIRECFSECHALQCGFCTPGMLASAYDIVQRLPMADRARIREELSGNLCRCTGYIGIINAVELALNRIHGTAKRGAALKEAMSDA
jgi:carbon-monoxide dehydrogenase small subunit